MIKKVTSKKDKEYIADLILKDLPEWFGLEDSRKDYIKKSVDRPFFAYYIDERPVGFIVFKKTSEDSGEIYVMGVLKDYHGKKIGSKLVETLENYAIEENYTFLQVKTVEKGHYREYDLTNDFYHKMGFKDLECFPSLWDEWNPCQILIKFLD